MEAAGFPFAVSPPFVLRLAPTHLGWGTRWQFTRRSRDPLGSKHRQFYKNNVYIKRGKNKVSYLLGLGVQLDRMWTVIGRVWFSFFLTILFENQLWEQFEYRGGLRVEEDEVVQRVQDLERDGFLLSWLLDQFCVYVDFGRFLPKWFLYKRAKKLGHLAVRNSSWWPEAKKAQTNRAITYFIFSLWSQSDTDIIKLCWIRFEWISTS
jgi:hypothetical protein